MASYGYLDTRHGTSEPVTMEIPNELNGEELTDELPITLNVSDLKVPSLNVPITNGSYFRTLECRLHEKHWDFLRADGFVRPYLQVLAETENKPEADSAYQTNELLAAYVIPAIFTWGLITNVPVILVLLGSSMRKLSGVHYLAGLCASDILYLAQVLLVWIGNTENHHENFYGLVGWCQFISYGSHICAFTSLWCTVALVVDRFVWVFFPDPARTMCTPTKAKAVLAGLIMLGVVVYLNTCLLEGLRPYGNRYLCEELRYYFSVIYVLRKLESIFLIGLPYFAMLLGSVAVATRLTRTRGLSPTGGDPSLYSKQEDLTRMAVVFTMVYLCTTTPAQVLRLYHLVISCRNNMSILSFELLQLENILLLMYNFRCALHLPLWIVCSSSFQHSLCLCFSCCRSGRRRQESPDSEVPLTVTRDTNT